MAVMNCFELNVSLTWVRKQRSIGRVTKEISLLFSLFSKQPLCFVVPCNQGYPHLVRNSHLHVKNLPPLLTPLFINNLFIKTCFFLLKKVSFLRTVVRFNSNEIGFNWNAINDVTLDRFTNVDVISNGYFNCQQSVIRQFPLQQLGAFSKKLVFQVS